MSWSVYLLGKPEAVSKELDAHGEEIGDPQSRQEFLEAKPHLQGLLAQVIGPGVKLEAYGYATFANGTKISGDLTVKLEVFQGKFCQ